MNGPKVQGGIIVAGLVTGVHVIADIKVPVPHHVAVFIPSDAASRSRDLNIGLQQGKLLKLIGGSGLVGSSTPVVVPPSNNNPSKELTALRTDNTRLQMELATARQQNKTLQEEVSVMQRQLGEILCALSRIEKSGGARVAAPAVEAGVGASDNSEAVGGEIPMFTPDLKSSVAKARIQVEKSRGAFVEDAVSKLKDLRHKS